MTCAVKVCESALREDFGFEHIVWIYSGRRGVHCWVCDETARELTNDARLAIIKYFSVVSGNENQAKKTQLSSPLHPSLERAYRLLEPLFVEHVIGSEGQGLLSSPERWETLLKTLPEEIGAQISKHWEKNGSDTTPLEKWEALKGLCVSEKPNQAKKQKRATVPELWKYETVFSQCYPRLDENVSKHRNHLLKSPFAAHPKTGRVCVPFDARQVSTFDPTTVVTLRQLAYELDQHSGDDVPDLDKTSLSKSVRFFEKDFLNPMMRAWGRARRDDAEYAAALKGDF